MHREWYILDRGEKKGPFALWELKEKYMISPDTLVWKKGFTHWKKAGKVKELEKIFIDEEKDKPIKKKLQRLKGPHLEEIIALQFSPRNFFWWLLAITLILLYSFFKIYYN